MSVAVLGRGWLVWSWIPKCETAIVEALGEKDDVGNGVVDGQDNHRREHLLCNSADDVGKVTEKPYYDEFDAQTFC